MLILRRRRTYAAVSSTPNLQRVPELMAPPITVMVRVRFRAQVIESVGMLLAAVNRLRGKLGEVATRQQETDVATSKMTAFGRFL